MLKGVSGFILSASVAGLSAIAVRYRPIPDFGSVNSDILSKSRYRMMNIQHEPVVLLLSRSVIMSTGALLAKFMINVLNSVVIPSFVLE